MGLINPALYEMEAQKACFTLRQTSGDKMGTYRRKTSTAGFHAVPGYDLAPGVATAERRVLSVS